MIDTSAQSLLAINPDKLFQENGVDKIKSIQAQIRNEIENKREELRTMVGERYRDLLRAADTITDMRQTADNVITRISRTETLCKTFQEKRVSGRKESKNVLRATNYSDVSKFIEIKTLLSLPEQIWMAIDNKNYLFGAELFLFANHIHFGIDLSQNATAIKEEYPVVSKQWEVITSYRNIIISGAQHQLKLIDLPHEIAGECLTCIIFLDVISYEKLIDEYLALRILKLMEILQSDELARNKLKLIVLLIQHTLSTVYHCFSGTNNKCLIDEMIEKIIGSNTKPTVSKLTQATLLPDHYLSPMIRDFHPSVKNELKCLTKPFIRDIMQSWLQEVDEILKTELKKLLMLINDIKRLHKIVKEDMLSMNSPDDWKIIADFLLDEDSVNIYNRYMKNIITERVTEIIEYTWISCIKNIMCALRDIDEEISKERMKQSENDVRWFVWRENIMDTHECLRLKTQGYTPRIVRLYQLLESSLKQLSEDVELYVGEGFSDARIDTSSSHAAHIFLFLNRCSMEMLKRLSGKIKSSCKQGSSLITESGIIVRARFLQSLITLSPSLEKCLRLGQGQALKELPENDLLNSWTESCNFLNEESSQIWQLWKEMTVVKLRSLVKMKLNSKISLRALLASKPLNEVISIEEQTEDGNRVKSDISVPSQPSLPLQDLLFQACQVLNAVVPHTLPRKIHQEVVDGFVLSILEHYQEWSKTDTIYQSQAWQMLLDVRLVTLLLITQENKNLSESVCETLEKIIDPFDLDVHYPHLQNSVKKSTQRLQGTMGILINFREKLPIFNGLKLTQNVSSTKVEEPNVLAMSDKIPWFTLLAVTNQTSEVSASKESTPEKTVKAKEREKENRRESKSRDFVRSANAFLNAMTSRWS